MLKKKNKSSLIKSQGWDSFLWEWKRARLCYTFWSMTTSLMRNYTMKKLSSSSLPDFTDERARSKPRTSFHTYTLKLRLIEPNILFRGLARFAFFFDVVCAFIQFLKCAIFSYSRPLWCYTKGDTISMHFSKILLDENSMNLCHYRSVGWESEGKCIYGSWLLEVSYLFSSGSLPFKIWVREADLSRGSKKVETLFAVKSIYGHPLKGQCHQLWTRKLPQMKVKFLWV